MGRNIKSDYEQSFNKKAVQADILPLIQGRYKHVVGLAGPNIDSYLRMVRNAGIKDASIYENNALQLLVQIQRFRNILPARVEFKDIIHAPSGQKDTLYDLDFCCSVFHANSHIKKFAKDDTITTLSVRPTTIEKTIEGYVKASFNQNNFNVEVEKATHSFTKYKLKIKNKSVGCYHYRDTTPMLVFVNIKNQSLWEK